MKALLYYEGDRVVMLYAGKRQHGKVTNVFEDRSVERTRYRVVFDGGSVCSCANTREIEPETPLDTLARCDALVQRTPEK